MNKMNKTEKKDSTQVSSNNLYLILLLALGLLIIFESVSIVSNKLGSREKQIPNQPPLINKEESSPQKTVEEEKAKATMSIVLDDNQKAASGRNIRAKVIFNSPREAVAGADAILTFDPKLVSITDIQGNKKIFGQIIINNQKQSEGRVKITAYQPIKTLTGEQELAFLTLHLLENRKATLAVEFLGMEASTDSNLISQESEKDILEEAQSLELRAKESEE